MDSHQEIAQIREMIRRKGLRATNARIAVIQKLMVFSYPACHTELAEMLVPMGFDKSTVYRSLNDLAESGLLHRSEFGDHVWRFEFLDPKISNQEIHPHFFCISCGSVTCLDGANIQYIHLLNNSEIKDITEIVIKGHCNNCRS